MRICNEDGYHNNFPRGTYNNPLDYGEAAPDGLEGRYIYARDDAGEVVKTINPNF